MASAGFRRWHKELQIQRTSDGVRIALQVTSRCEDRKHDDDGRHGGSAHQTKNAAQAESAEAAPPCAMVISGWRRDRATALPRSYNLAMQAGCPTDSSSWALAVPPGPEEWRKSLAGMMKKSIAQDDHIDQTGLALAYRHKGDYLNACESVTPRSRQNLLA